MELTLRSQKLTMFGGAVKNWLRRCEVDRAVLFALLSRIWLVVAGPITILLIVRHLSPEIQGFYYTFASLLVLQSFVELGFYIVIIYLASHEWSQLRINSKGRIEGSPEALSRLVNLAHLIFKWYAVASVLYIIGVSIVGYIFFSQSSYPDVHWQGPWLTLVLFTGLLLWMLPFNSLLEGCNQVATINLFRLIQVLLGSLALWATLAWHWGLWAAVAMVTVRLICNMYLLFVRYRHFFTSFFRYPISVTMSWKSEIWPMQWRLGLSGIVNYFAFSLFNPVMFHYHDATIAGRMGMTWQVVGALQEIGLAWLTAKGPRFGMLIAQKEYKQLDRLWIRTSLVSFSVVCFGGVVLWFLLYGLNMFQIPVAQRLLSPLPAGLFLLACILRHIGACQTTYLRAHKKEPIVVMSVTSCLVIGLLVWLLGSHFGPVGAAWGYLGVVCIQILWETNIWFRCRAKWHRD